MIEIASIKRRVNAFARTALTPVPLHFWQAAFPKDVVALCYHVVSDEDLPHLQLYPYKNAEQFEADVIFARSRATTYRQVADRRLEGKPLARNSILFTFDDGLTQCYDVARPILKKLGVDAVFFVTTDYLDDRETFFESTQSLCAAAIATIDAARARKILATLEGDAAGADATYSEVIQLAETMNDPAEACTATRGRAEAQLSLGKPAEALLLADRAAELARSLRDPEAQWRTESLAGDALRAQGDLAGARKRFQAAVFIVESQRFRIAGGDQERRRYFEQSAFPYQSLVRVALDAGDKFAALQYAESSHARVLREILDRGPVSVFSGRLHGEF